MEISELRILFIVDAIKGRNGVGTYFQDLVSHIQEHVTHAELISPSMDEADIHQGMGVPMLGDPTQKLYFPKMRALTQTFFRVKPHVIVIPGPGIYSLAGYWLAKKMGIPVCVTYQSDYLKMVDLYWSSSFAKMVGSLLNWLNTLMFNGSSSVITVSEEMVAKARNHGIHNPYLVATPLAREFIRQPLIAPESKIKNVLFIGRLAAEKNLDRFMDLARERRDLRFKIIGDGPQRERVQSWAQKLENLEYVGWTTRAQVIHHLDKAQLLILPSSVEAFGTVALEALSRKRLVLTAPACGINQWPEVKGALFVQKKEESLGQALQRIEHSIACPQTHAAITNTGRKAAVTINNQAVQQWLNVLQSSARHHLFIPTPRRSPTLALLRRLG